MNLAKGSVGFKPPTPIDEAWRRLEQRGGSRADLESVLSFLAKLWASEPDPFAKWLVENHRVRKEDLPPSILAEYRKGFERHQGSKLKETRELLEGLAAGPHLTRVLEYSTAFSSELKGLVYRSAISTPRNEDVVFVLSALSLESPHFVQECTTNVPESPVLRAFLAYIRGARIPLALEDRQPLPVAENLTPIDRLFHLTTLPLKKLVEGLRSIPEPELKSLAALADRLFHRLSDKGFEFFVKLNVSVFVCAAEPRGKLIPSAVQTLVSTGEPGVADVLILLGENYLIAELRDARNSKPGRERFLAAVIDACRRLYPESISNLQGNLTTLASSKIPVLEVAVRAALLQLNPNDASTFERLLLRRLRTDKEQHVRAWLLRNPEFVRYLRVEKASFNTLRSILDTYKTTRPELALRIIEQILNQPPGPAQHRYWEEAIKVLVGIGTDQADVLFSNFITRRIADGLDDPQVQEVLIQEPSWALLRRNFWRLLDRAGTQRGWQILFDVYAARAPVPDLVRLIEAAYIRSDSLSAWIVERLVPKLLESEPLSLTFQRYITNHDFLTMTAKHLCWITLETTNYLRGVANEWASIRANAKQKLLPKVQTGTRIALKNTLIDSTLRSQVARLAKHVEAWADSDSPKLDAAIASYASTSTPSEYAPDRNRVDQFFREQQRGPNDFALFVGGNPWVIDVIFADERGPWPKPDLLLSQILRSFIFVTQLRRRAEAQIETIEHRIRVELATTLRELLADIEAELTGYFIFRDILGEVGLHPVMRKLGEPVEEKDLSSRQHKVIRDADRRGLLRVFGLGVRVDEMIVGSGTVMKSGDDDDRD